METPSPEPSVTTKPLSAKERYYRQRQPPRWLFWGMVVVLVGLIVLAFVPNRFLVKSYQLIFGQPSIRAHWFFINEAITGPLIAFRADVGTFPTTAQGLAALLENPGIEGWNGPYINRADDLLDPWGNPYQYRSPGLHNPSGYDVWSMGQDTADPRDDVGNWQADDSD